MSLVTGTIPSLHNGVSQQSAIVRAVEQCERQLNGWPSLSEGLGKRAPTETAARLMPEAPSNAAIHEINRDSGEQYVVVAAGGVIRVFDFDGNEKTVNAPDGWGYLDGIDDYGSQVSMSSVADYTFVVNRTKTCALAAAGTDATADPAYYIWPNRTYGTDDLAVTFGPGQPYQYEPNPVLTTGLTGTVQSFDKLPTTGVTDGSVFAITGNETTKFVSYYVRKNGAVWDECVKPGLINAIDSTTMPHALVRESDGTFSFAPFSWAPRRVGDADTNPNPTFIGRTINGLFIYQNRLAFLSDENIVLSGIGDFGNFWRMTVLDYIDSDTISLAATSTKVSILHAAAAFNDGIILTSDQTQFAVSNGEAGVSPSSIAIKPVTSYEVTVKAGLSSMNTEVYFASERNGWAVIREYTRDPNSDATSASDVTAHVPRYIPAGVRKIIPAGDVNALFVLTDGAPGSVYVYNLYWLSDTQKAQSAWHEWTFGEDARVISGVYLKGVLYLLVARPDGLFLERVNLQAGAKAPGCSAQVFLDRRTSVTGVYDATTQTTLFTLPMEPNQEEARLVRSDAFGNPLSLIDPTTYTWVDPDKVRVPGNETAGPVLAGERYTFRYRFSAQYLRRNDGTAVTTGRFQLRTFTVAYRDAAYFKTEVAPYGDTPVVEEVIPAKLAEFSGKVLGAADLILNRPVFHAGRYSFQVYGQGDVATIELVNDTHVGSQFIAAEWEAFYWNRARV